MNRQTFSFLPKSTVLFRQRRSCLLPQLFFALCFTLSYPSSHNSPPQLHIITARDKSPGQTIKHQETSSLIRPLMMPPKKTPTDTAATTPGHNCNNSEVALMLAILRQIDRPAIDMNALADAVGAASANAARTRISAATSKHGWFTNSTTATTGNVGSPATPRGKKAADSSGRKKKAPADESDDEELQTPSEKKRLTTKAKGAVKAEPAEGNTSHDLRGDGEQNDAPKKFNGDDGI
ncbi:hypothetical protein LZ30DRAFT_648605 [Colletotrichum cereale]|nr:hypothetical protein LZ30DRAFT_648605 [Colletotrichum cereale]